MELQYNLAIAPEATQFFSRPHRARSLSAMESSNKPALAPPTTFNQEKTVTRLVGPDKKALMVHEFQLASSEFFKAAMKKEWAEGQTRTVSFPDDDPDDFAHYLDWMYFGNFPTSIYDEYDNPPDGD